MSDAPAPGSDEAIDAGCICAVLDNAHGIGWHGVPGEYLYTLGCPVHAPIHCPDCGDELPGCRCASAAEICPACGEKLLDVGNHLPRVCPRCDTYVYDGGERV